VVKIFLVSNKDKDINEEAKRFDRTKGGK